MGVGMDVVYCGQAAPPRTGTEVTDPGLSLDPMLYVHRIHVIPLLPLKMNSHSAPRPSSGGRKGSLPMIESVIVKLLTPIGSGSPSMFRLKLW